MPSSRRVSQGAVISLVLYNIYVTDIPPTDTLETHAIQSADDRILLSFGDDTEEAAENLQGLPNITQDFCHRWKLRINPEKSKILKISGLKCKQSYRTRRLTKIAQFHINGAPINELESLKHLGITYNTKFDFTQHANSMIERGP